mgnify:CR=1 FL=1
MNYLKMRYFLHILSLANEQTKCKALGFYTEITKCLIKFVREWRVEDEKGSYNRRKWPTWYSGH